MLQSYNLKIIETATYIEVYEYLDAPVFYNIGLTKEKSILEYDENEINNIENENTEIATDYYDSLRRKQKHYEKMRWEIARIIDCNFDDNTKFMTLTFKDNIQDVTYTNNEFKKFIKRLNYYLYKDKKHHLKYLAVWEKQKRGAIHYHVIFFNLPYIKSKTISEIWTNGFIKINKIDVDSKDNRGRYVSKYFSKDIDEKDYKQKAFFKSQNLILPNIKHYFYGEQLSNLEFPEESIVYSKTYTHKVPRFNDRINISFKDGTVRYTKIRKDDINDNANKH